MPIGFIALPRPGRFTRCLALLLALGLVAAACGDDDDSAAAGASDEGGEESAGDTGADAEPSGSLRLGYFPNVTHAPAIIGVQDGLFEEALGDGVELETTTFNAGGEAIEALFSDAIDATFVGPNPAINGFSQSEGTALRIVAGTTSGGASLVVRDGIDSPDDLEGTTLATPALGNTQDVALRAWLLEQGYETDLAGGGDVSITPQDNPDTLTAFQQGDIDGAWLPEPWATRLILEGEGQVLVDEADLWPEGEFVTTHLIVATEYLEEHPANVRALVEGLLEAIDVANDDAAEAQTITNDGIEADTTNRLADETIAGAWENLSFTPDPIASSLEESKDDAVEVELLDDVDLGGIYDLAILNQLLAERGEAEVYGL
ncbi:MAG TPA: ABC transporter substrate-binding protein [Acidimicrobiales bacterium]|nr:ABC transporter substrate-binding protein [Acidimicrobiales bacterium]